jgi:4-hydroxy-tetrahydrodipicolinate reductase
VTAPAAATGLAIFGASGRMGLSVLRLLPEFPSLRLKAALCSATSPAVGRDSGELAGLGANGVSLSAEWPADTGDIGLALDFSVPAAAISNLRRCAASGVALLLGTTGLGADAAEPIEEASRRIPVLVAPNTSRGAGVLMSLARRAAAALGDGYDVSLHDVHHRGKRDAPSGTSLALGEAIQRSVGGPSVRVGYTSVRGGDVVGQHEVRFLGAGESVRLSHEVTDRAVFARGALEAALWLIGKPPGRYAMADLIEEK